MIDIRKLAVDQVQEYFRADTVIHQTMVDLLDGFGRLVLNEYATKVQEAPASEYGRFNKGNAPTEPPTNIEDKEEQQKENPGTVIDNAIDGVDAMEFFRVD